MIVCWEHDWHDCPKSIEVLELRTEYKNYPNEEVEEPDKPSIVGDRGLEDHFRDYTQSKRLYEGFHRMVSQVDKEVWRKIADRSINYHCPEKVFLYLRIQKKGLMGHIYTGGKRIKGVETISEKGSYAQKWGRFYVMNDKELKESKTIVKRSLSLIRSAIDKNENTSWYSEIE